MAPDAGNLVMSGGASARLGHFDPTLIGSHVTVTTSLTSDRAARDALSAALAALRAIDDKPGPATLIAARLAIKDVLSHVPEDAEAVTTALDGAYIALRDASVQADAIQGPAAIALKAYGENAFDSLEQRDWHNRRLLVALGTILAALGQHEPAPAYFLTALVWAEALSSVAFAIHTVNEVTGDHWLTPAAFAAKLEAVATDVSDAVLDAGRALSYDAVEEAREAVNETARALGIPLVGARRPVDGRTAWSREIDGITWTFTVRKNPEGGRVLDVVRHAEDGPAPYHSFRVTHRTDELDLVPCAI
ncbi:hypothetical protein [Streptomyces sp. bgisy154]|uniref:hypothetical protein n=1 Tax=Streptomyces sp. bgisy154 TaxID=3413794 RepID=UPI003D72F400